MKIKDNFTNARDYIKAVVLPAFLNWQLRYQLLMVLSILVAGLVGAAAFTFVAALALTMAAVAIPLALVAALVLLPITVLGAIFGAQMSGFTRAQQLLIAPMLLGIGVIGAVVAASLSLTFSALAIVVMPAALVTAAAALVMAGVASFLKIFSKTSTPSHARMPSTETDTSEFRSTRAMSLETLSSVPAHDGDSRLAAESDAAARTKAETAAISAKNELRKRKKDKDKDKSHIKTMAELVAEGEARRMGKGKSK